MNSVTAADSDQHIDTNVAMPHTVARREAANGLSTVVILGARF
ncbi:hypothetical protein [Levilactobacillus brevis]|nr:hypothetical protein [Levilactobacillus brevis]